MLATTRQYLALPASAGPCLTCCHACGGAAGGHRHQARQVVGGDAAVLLLGCGAGRQGSNTGSTQGGGVSGAVRVVLSKWGYGRLLGVADTLCKHQAVSGTHHSVWMQPPADQAIVVLHGLCCHPQGVCGCPRPSCSAPPAHSLPAWLPGWLGVTPPLLPPSSPPLTSVHLAHGHQQGQQGAAGAAGQQRELAIGAPRTQQLAAPAPPAAATIWGAAGITPAGGTRKRCERGECLIIGTQG